jgi:signal transduction histidine kinase
MKLYELIPLCAALINFGLTIFVLTRNLSGVVTRVYALWGVSVTVWNLGTFFMFQAKSPADALFWAHFLQFGVIFVPISLSHLCLLIAHIPIHRRFYLGYVVLAALACTNLGHNTFFVDSVKKVSYAYYSVAGPGFLIFSVTYVLPVLSVRLLYEKRKTLPPLHQTRLTYMMVAVCTLIVFGINDTLPILGVYKYPFTDSDIFPFGSLAAIAYGIIVGYSVLQHQLLDIYVALSQVAARFVRLMFLLLIGLGVLLLLSVFNPDAFNFYSFSSALAAMLVSAFAAATLFPRIFGRGDDALERRILGDRFEYHDKLKSFIDNLHAYADTSLLLNDLHHLLVQTMSISSYHIVLLDEKKRVFSAFRYYPKQSRELAELHWDSPILQFFQKTQKPYLPFNIAYSMPGDTHTERIAREQLNTANPEFCFPFYSGKEPFGLLLIGAKTSGEPYTPHDLNLLVLMMNTLSLIINQIRLKEQILVAQEIELLGRMSRGMAHDLNNLMTPIWTYLQLAKEALNGDYGSHELLPIAARNVETIRAYIKEALFFSNTQTPHFAESCLAATILKAVAVAEPRAQVKNVSIDCKDLRETKLEIDAVLIQRLITNLLANAIDASPPGSVIEVRVLQRINTKATREWYTLQIMDHGEGITRENLKQMFVPYFTTKDRGSEERGFGLGLSISRKIVHLHGGDMTIDSEEKRGTTVQVHLPSRQAKKAELPTSFAE